MDIRKLVESNLLNNTLNSVDLLSSVIDTAALVTPQEDVGFNGWLFHIPQDSSLEFNSNITDHYVENNKAVQDNVSLQPIEYTVTGLIGELNWRDVYDKTQQAVAAVEDKLPILSILTPELTAQALQTFNLVDKAYNTAKKLGKLAGDNNDDGVYEQFLKQAGKSFTSAIPGKLKQQELAVNFFFWAWQGRKLFRVQTPWRIFENMVIKSCRATQSESGKTATNLVITFKQLNIINWKIVNKKIGMSRNATQTAAQVNKGTSKTEQDTDGFLLKMAKGFAN